MAKSILQGDKRCYICGNTYNLHEHHIFFGSNRRNSEKHGFKVWLCGPHHNLSNEGVHFDRTLDLYLKRQCQKAFEKTHSREEFLNIIGKNYLTED